MDSPGLDINVGALRGVRLMSQRQEIDVENTYKAAEMLSVLLNVSAIIIPPNPRPGFWVREAGPGLRWLEHTSGYWT